MTSSTVLWLLLTASSVAAVDQESPSSRGVLAADGQLNESTLLTTDSCSLLQLDTNIGNRRGRASRRGQSALAVQPGPAGESTCGLEADVTKEDCDRADTGSCGNGCCALEVDLQMDPDAVYRAVSRFLKSGGDGRSYTLVPGEMPFDEHPPDNLTSLNISGGWKFIFQGKHTTSGRHYVDTLNFNIRSSKTNRSTLRAFSISDLHGALGDAGQNYKTLAYMFQALGYELAQSDILYGCGKKGGRRILQPVSIALTPVTPESNSSTCGMAGDVPGCGRVDMGSCGNACCAMEVRLRESPTEVYEAVAAFLSSNIGDGAYKHVPGKMPHDEHPPDNLTSLDVPGGFKYIFQGTHTTSGRHYNDTLNFNIRLDGDSSILRAFSISDLHGALGDAGQNYKTLSYMFEALAVSPSVAQVLYGCNSSWATSRSNLGLVALALALLAAARELL
mmetsp:Transcript_44966/g.103982  ORF Transcript_44966/g.103982 Transcript_44966/m.103982 type:complete len:447 (-) Transcript_44966:62-1402(-)